jgi:hypothetical protein
MKKEKILKLLKRFNKIEKDIFNDIVDICNKVRSYKMVLKSIYFNKDKESESYKMSLRVKENYEKQLKEMYFRIKKMPCEEL